MGEVKKRKVPFARAVKKRREGKKEDALLQKDPDSTAANRKKREEPCEKELENGKLIDNNRQQFGLKGTNERPQTSSGTGKAKKKRKGITKSAPRVKSESQKKIRSPFSKDKNLPINTAEPKTRKNGQRREAQSKGSQKKGNQET